MTQREIKISHLFVYIPISWHAVSVKKWHRLFKFCLKQNIILFQKFMKTIFFPPAMFFMLYLIYMSGGRLSHSKPSYMKICFAHLTILRPQGQNINRKVSESQIYVVTFKLQFHHCSIPPKVYNQYNDYPVPLYLYPVNSTVRKFR